MGGGFVWLWKGRMGLRIVRKARSVDVEVIAEESKERERTLLSSNARRNRPGDLLRSLRHVSNFVVVHLEHNVCYVEVVPTASNNENDRRIPGLDESLDLSERKQNKTQFSSFETRRETEVSNSLCEREE